MTEQSQQPVQPLIRWDVPGLGGTGSVELSVCAGQALVLVGANGAGKSALSYWMSVTRTSFVAPITRVIAHPSDLVGFGRGGDDDKSTGSK
jgi:hypothetical protein